MLGVDIGADPSVALGLRHGMHGQGGLTRGLGPVDLHDASPRETADPQGQVEGERSGRDGLDVHADVVAHAHDRALAELLLDLPQGGVQRLVPLRLGHLPLLRVVPTTLFLRRCPATFVLRSVRHSVPVRRPYGGGVTDGAAAPVGSIPNVCSQNVDPARRTDPAENGPPGPLPDPSLTAGSGRRHAMLCLAGPGIPE